MSELSLTVLRLPEGTDEIQRAFVRYLVNHPGAHEEQLLRLVVEGVSPKKVREVGETLLAEMVEEGSLRWGQQKNKPDAPLRYWVARRSGDYACETKPACLCVESEDTCECSRDAGTGLCRHCGAPVLELDVTDHRVARPFQGEFLPCPGADPPSGDDNDRERAKRADAGARAAKAHQAALRAGLRGQTTPARQAPPLRREAIPPSNSRTLDAITEINAHRARVARTR